TAPDVSASASFAPFGSIVAVCASSQGCVSFAETSTAGSLAPTTTPFSSFADADTFAPSEENEAFTVPASALATFATTARFAVGPKRPVKKPGFFAIASSDAHGRPSSFTSASTGGIAGGFGFRKNHGSGTERSAASFPPPSEGPA